MNPPQRATSGLTFFKPMRARPGDCVAFLYDDGEVASIFRRVREPYAAAQRFSCLVLVEAELPGNANFEHAP